MIPNDKETLMLLYGKKKQNLDLKNMRGRNLSPSQQFLLESINSLERMQDSMIVSPNPDHVKSDSIISPELNFENHAAVSEDEGSPEKENKERFNLLGKPKSALSRFQGSRYFSNPQASRRRSKKSISSSRGGIPTYFKDAAELLKSRLQKQIRKYFNILKNHESNLPRQVAQNEVYFEPEEQVVQP